MRRAAEGARAGSGATHPCPAREEQLLEAILRVPGLRQQVHLEAVVFVVRMELIVYAPPRFVATLFPERRWPSRVCGVLPMAGGEVEEVGDNLGATKREVSLRKHARGGWASARPRVAAGRARAAAVYAP